MAATRDIKDFKGNYLLIGCGHNHTHYFNIADNSPLLSVELHPKKDFYTLGLENLSLFLLSVWLLFLAMKKLPKNA